MQFGLSKVWTVLLFISGIVFIWVASSFTASMIMYQRYGRSAPAEILNWGTYEHPEGVFHICADYKYQVDNEPTFSQYEFKSYETDNQDAAEYNLEQLKKQTWRAWYHKSGEQMIALLEHPFPKKDLFYFSLSLLVLVYFLWLRGFLGRYSETDGKPAVAGG